MRTLSRPMFNMGGPIKQGVMHGIREPYKHGGPTGTGLGGDIGALGQLGALRQGQTQANLTANQQAAQTAAYEPYGRLSQYGQGITGLAGGVAGMQYQDPAPANPWASALGTAMGVGGLFGKIYG